MHAVQTKECKISAAKQRDDKERKTESQRERERDRAGDYNYDIPYPNEIATGVVLVIIRHHGVGELTGQVEMVPTSFPELPKPSRTLGICQIHMFYNPIVYRQNPENVIISWINPFKATYIALCSPLKGDLPISRDL